MSEEKNERELSEVRVDIDRVDAGIRELFKERMALADEVARIKAQTADVIYKPDREAAIISRLTADVDPSILKEYTAVIRRIMEISRKYQYGRTLELRDCLELDPAPVRTGIKTVICVDTETELCRPALDEGVTVINAEHYAAAAEAVMSGDADACVGVMEEIGIGVNEGLDRMLVEHPMYINSCRVLEKGGVRRKIVSCSPVLTADPGDNRVKLMFVCPNRSGSLASILSMIADYDVNLTEIHSKPDRNRDWNYYFILELGANILEKEIRALIFQLKNETSNLKVLGSYRL